MPEWKACYIAGAEIQELLFENNCESKDNGIGDLSDDSDYDVSDCALENVSTPF